MKISRFNGHRLSVLVLVLGALAFAHVHADERTDVSELMRTGKLTEALAKADQFLASQPKDAQMRFLKGVIQRESGKTSEAITTFSRMTEDYPDLPEPYNNLAVLYASLGQYDRARAALESAIRTNPTYSTAHENLGDVYAKLASQAYNKALQLDENNAAVGPKLALIRDLFNPMGVKTQRQAALGPVPPPPQIASLSPNKPVPAPPTLPAPKQAAAVASQTPASIPAPAVAAPAVIASAPMATAAATSTATKPSTAPVVSATPATPPSTSAASAMESNGAKEVEKFVRKWASAWASKDVKSYLGFYGKEFNPPGNLDRSSWEAERRARILGKSSISVKVDNLTSQINGDKATVKFRQTYKAGNLDIASRKVLELAKIGDHWRIVKESAAN